MYIYLYFFPFMLRFLESAKHKAPSHLSSTLESQGSRPRGCLRPAPGAGVAPAGPRAPAFAVGSVALWEEHLPRWLNLLLL